MKTSSILAAGLFVASAVVALPASAKIADFSYFVPGESPAEYLAPSTFNRADVKAQARLAENQIWTPRTEFGAGSHDSNRSLRARADVKAEAVAFERTGAHKTFSY